MTRRRSAMLGVLGLGFLGAWMTGACGSPGEPGAANSCPAPVETPPDATGECAEPSTEPCMRYHIPLLGDPNSNLTLREKYITEFGSACYVPEDPMKPFNCFYTTWQEACADAVKIGELSGNAPYNPNGKCTPVGNGDYWLQTGSDIANGITIAFMEAPLETSLIDIKTVPTEVNGPYRNLVEVTIPKPDTSFYCTSGQVGADGKPLSQKDWILEVNRKAHGGKIHSDLAGFTWPCKDDNCKPTTCTEELVLKEPSDPRVYDPDEAQVHHVVPRKDLRGCRWGTNAYKNAAVISARLNQYLLNKIPPIKEVVQINSVSPYSP